MNRKYCAGCRDNFYNGNNEFGVMKCWHLENAKVQWKIQVGVWENPPYLNKRKQRVASCYQGNGIIFIDPAKSLRSDGYWR
ncbi:MAG: hypothetical protein PHF86_15035 [Candidatus Nanoarchaeia archaeon]|jgi:CMP-N-acetylneuraminic acid synthetase|nr:hypothetical protein [Candidatus Nanoarchaeia archaeon]